MTDKTLPKPALPTEGYIEAWGVPTFGAEEIHLKVAMPDEDGDWYGLTDGVGRYLTPDQITRWRRVRIISADDDGLRERVEKLADDFESLPHSTGTGRYIAHSLRTALAETSADA